MLKGKINAAGDVGLRNLAVELESSVTILTSEVLNLRSAVEVRDREISALKRELQTSVNRQNSESETQLLNARA